MSEKVMEVPVSWFSLKDPLNGLIQASLGELSDDGRQELDQAGIIAALIYFSNIGHPNRWSRTFPIDIDLSVNQQPIPADTDFTLVMSIDALFEQVASHIDKWRLGIPSYEDLDTWSKESTNRQTGRTIAGLRFLARTATGRPISLDLEARYFPSSHYTVKAVR